MNMKVRGILYQRKMMVTLCLVYEMRKSLFDTCAEWAKKKKEECGGCCEEMLSCITRWNMYMLAPKLWLARNKIKRGKSVCHMILVKC